MYLHCKAGFYEVDRYMDTPVQPVDGHVPPVDGIIVRSRRQEDLQALIDDYLPDHCLPEILRTPQWDYPFRIYLTEDEWAEAMANVARDLDYRNFKTRCDRFAPERYELAHAIWASAAAEPRWIREHEEGMKHRQ